MGNLKPAGPAGRLRLAIFMSFPILQILGRHFTIWRIPKEPVSSSATKEVNSSQTNGDTLVNHDLLIDGLAVWLAVWSSKGRLQCLHKSGEVG